MHDSIISTVANSLDLEPNEYNEIAIYLYQTINHLYRNYKYKCDCSATVRLDNVSHFLTKKHMHFVLKRRRRTAKPVLDDILIPDLTNIILPYI